MTNPSEQSIEVRQQILDTLWLTEELLETPAHISITSNDINRLVALVDKATREAVVAELKYVINSLEVRGTSFSLRRFKEELEELSNKEKQE